MKSEVDRDQFVLKACTQVVQRNLEKGLSEGQRSEIWLKELLETDNFIHEASG